MNNKRTKNCWEVEYAMRETIIAFFNEIGEIVIEAKAKGLAVPFDDVGPGEVFDVYRIAKNSKLFRRHIELGSMGIENPNRESYDKTIHIIKVFFDDLFDNMVDFDKISYLQYFKLVINELRMIHNDDAKFEKLKNDPVMSWYKVGTGEGRISEL